jgi:hypothetical protein
MNRTKYLRTIALLISLALALGGVAPAVGKVLSGFDDAVNSPVHVPVQREMLHCDQSEQKVVQQHSFSHPKNALMSDQATVNDGLAVDCCEEQCLCGQGGCHQSLNVSLLNSLCTPDLSDHSHGLSMSFYQPPSFEHSNPPPIS